MSNEISQPRASFHRVWDALDAGGFAPTARRGDKFTALCPVHGDSHPSLSVRYDAARELTMLHCFSCDADYADIAAGLNLTAVDLFDRPLPDRPRTEWMKTRPKRPVAFKAPHKKLPARLVKDSSTRDLTDATWSRVTTYTYADAAGTVVQEVVREQTTVAGETHKRFLQRFINPSTQRWVKTKPEGFVPVLYNHAATVAAVETGTPVYLVEGEKDADNANERGVVATTNAQGAGSFPEQLADVLTGGIINIVADKDPAGYKRAATLHDLLTQRNATVRILVPAVDAEKADLTDHLEAGHDISELVEISLVDARALAALGDARKALEQLTVCKVEAQAQVDVSTTPEVVSKNAEIWANESELRYRRIHELINAARTELEDVTPLGSTALAALVDVDEDAAAIARDTHKIAGIQIPKSIDVAPLNPAPVVHIDTPTKHETPPPFRGNTWLRDDDGEPNIGSNFIVRLGETVQVKREKDGDGERNRYHRVLRGWADIQSISVDDDGNDTGVTRTTHSMTILFSRWKRNDKGDPILADDGEPIIETARVRWDADQIRDGSWAQALPWPGMLESGTRRGKDTAWDAIFNARPAPIDRSIVHVATGWRESDAGPFFVHAGGAIAKGGSLPLNVDLADAFTPYKLPEPTSMAQELREAFQTGTLPLMDLPARVMGPLLGVVWESVFERVPMILHFQGGAYSAKTSTARLGCQFFAPELNYHGKREIFSGSNMGATTIGLIRALSAVNNLPVLIDDIAPDGDVKRAQKKLSELARLIYNGTGRVTGKQRGGVSMETPPTCTVITTGEMGITGSGLTRMVTIPLDRGVIPDPASTFAELEKSASRRARGLLGSSLIQWIALHRDALRNEQQAFVDDPTNPESPFKRWSERVAQLPHDEGLKGRLVEGAMAADHGIRLMMRMLVDQGAIDGKFASVFHKWAADGIFEAIALQDAASSDPAEQLLHYLREALASGAGHLADEHNGLPKDPETKGWIVRGVGPAAWSPSGPRLGFVKDTPAGERVYLLPGVVIGVALTLANRADATFEGTPVSIASSMVSRGWITPDKAGKSQPVKRIGAQVMRVWDIPMSLLLGEAPEDPTTDDTSNDPTPSLFDDGESWSRPEPEPLAPTDDAPAEDPWVETTEAAYSAPAAPEQPAVAHSSSAAAVDEQPLPSAPEEPAQVLRTSPTTEYRAAAAVLDTDGLWFPDGSVEQLPFPLRHLGDVVQLSEHFRLGTVISRWKDRSNEEQMRVEGGQIWVTTRAAAELGIPVDGIVANKFQRLQALREVTTDIPFVRLAVSAGWQVGGDRQSLSPVTRVWKAQDRRNAHQLVLIDFVKDDFRNSVLADDPAPATIARRLQAFADAVGYPYTVSATTTAFNLMDTLRRKDRDEVFAPTAVIPPHSYDIERDIFWTRKPTEEELGHEFVHGYDRGASYLGAAQGVNFGIGSPVHQTADITFDPKLPGYWLVSVPPKTEWLWPNPLDPVSRTEQYEQIWVTTPRLAWAIAQGYEDLQIHEAYVWLSNGRILDGWAGRVSDALKALDTGNPDDKAARAIVKQFYVRTFGEMASFTYHEGRRFFAPERFHTIQERASTNILRRIQKIGTDTGRWPVAIERDLVLYTSPEPDPTAGWPGDAANFGRGVGQFKAELTGRLEVVLPYLDGTRFRGKSMLNSLK